jgi:hypothetical protein
VRKPFYWLSPLLSLFIRLGVGRSGLQTANDFGAVAAEVRETAQPGVDDEKNDTVKGTQEGVSGGATDVEDVRDVVQDTGVRVIDGAQVTLNQSSTRPESCLESSDAEKTSLPMASNFGDLTGTRPLPHVIGGSRSNTRRRSVETRLCGMAFPGRPVCKL